MCSGVLCVKWVCFWPYGWYTVDLILQFKYNTVLRFSVLCCYSKTSFTFTTFKFIGKLVVSFIETSVSELKDLEDMYFSRCFVNFSIQIFDCVSFISDSSRSSFLKTTSTIGLRWRAVLFVWYLPVKKVSSSMGSVIGYMRVRQTIFLLLKYNTMVA